MGKRKSAQRGRGVPSSFRSHGKRTALTAAQLQQLIDATQNSNTGVPRGRSLLPGQLRCVHVSLIVHACIAIASHVLVPVWMAFITPYGLVLGSLIMLAGAAGAPMRGWRSRAAAILADDWKLPFMVALVWVTLAQGHGMDLMARNYPEAATTPAATFGRHAWVGAAGVAGLCSVVLEYNLSTMQHAGKQPHAQAVASDTPQASRASVAASATGVVPDSGRGMGAPSPHAESGSPPAADNDSAAAGGALSKQPPQPVGVQEPRRSARPVPAVVEALHQPAAVASHEIYGPRRPLMYIITDIAAFSHGITWFFVAASTRTISLPFVLWMAVAALCGEALYSDTLVQLPTLRYHGIMWTAAVGCLALYGWSSDWQFPELPLLNREVTGSPA